DHAAAEDRRERALSTDVLARGAPPPRHRDTPRDHPRPRHLRSYGTARLRSDRTDPQRFGQASRNSRARRSIRCPPLPGRALPARTDNRDDNPEPPQLRRSISRPGSRATRTQSFAGVPPLAGLAPFVLLRLSAWLADVSP